MDGLYKGAVTGKTVEAMPRAFVRCGLDNKAKKGLCLAMKVAFRSKKGRQIVI